MRRVYNVIITRSDGITVENLNLPPADVLALVERELGPDDFTVLDIRIRRVLPTAPYAPPPEMVRALRKWETRGA